MRRGNIITSADPRTGLGADNRSGAAAVLTVAWEILRNKMPHPPLTFFFPVQEEVGLIGARHVSLSKLGQPRMAFNYDGGAANEIVMPVSILRMASVPLLSQGLRLPV